MAQKKRDQVSLAQSLWEQEKFRDAENVFAELDKQ